MSMKERNKGMNKFKKFFVIYVAVLIVLILGIWFVAWNYAAAYEMAQPKGAINAYMEESMKQELSALLDAYSGEKANDYQTTEEVFAVMSAKVLDREWTYRKSKEFISAAPVYTLYCGDDPLGTVSLKPGEADALDFGLIPWETDKLELDLAQLEKTITIVAPADCEVTLNGAAVKNAAETAAFYPAYAQYADTIKQPMELLVYRVDEICVDEITVDCGDLRLVEAEEAYTYYAVPQPDDATATILEELAPQFAEAYLKYSANADTYYNVSRFVAPGSELLERLYKSRDGMSWVSYTTGKITKCEVSEVEYFGNVATYDVEYMLDIKSGEMAGNMHVIAVHADYGWRVTDIELF